MNDNLGPNFHRAPVQESLNPVWLARLRRVLRLVGYVSLLAFGAAIMPNRWMIEIAGELGFEDFPAHPLTFYLARHLSAMYGFVGCALLLLASDLVRYFPLVLYAGWGTVLLGVLQLGIDASARLPTWWTLGEALSTAAGGCLLLWLERRCKS